MVWGDMELEMVRVVELVGGSLVGGVLEEGVGKCFIRGFVGVLSNRAIYFLIEWDFFFR